jgi:hypothetical protein
VWRHSRLPTVDSSCSSSRTSTTTTSTGRFALLGDQQLGATFGDVWFNGWRHLPDTPLESLGPVEGERLTDTLVSGDIPWNEAFDGRAVGVRSEGNLPRRELPGELHVTVLAPTAEQLGALKPVWRKVVQDAGLVPGQPPQPEPEPLPEGLESLGPGEPPDVPALAALPFKADAAEANGSSIVVLLEHDGANVLLCGDAFPAVVSASVDRLRAERGGDRVAVGAFKLPHHGSHANVSKDLIAKLDCPRYLFSSNGAHTRHPHPEAVARVLVADAGERTLFFNYRTGFNEVWANEQLQAQHHYATAFPPQGGVGIAVDI